MRTCASEREEFGIVIHIVEDITHLYVVQSVKKVFQKTIQIVFGNDSWYWECA
jgi:hypothetical protein